MMSGIMENSLLKGNSYITGYAIILQMFFCAMRLYIAFVFVALAAEWTRMPCSSFRQTVDFSIMRFFNVYRKKFFTTPPTVKEVVNQSTMRCQTVETEKFGRAKGTNTILFCDRQSGQGVKLVNKLSMII